MQNLRLSLDEERVSTALAEGAITPRQASNALKFIREVKDFHSSPLAIPITVDGQFVGEICQVGEVWISNRYGKDYPQSMEFSSEEKAIAYASGEGVAPTKGLDQPRVNVKIQFSTASLKSEEIGEYTWKGLAMRKTPLSAKDLLEFAVADLLDGASDRNAVNALSNAKKALHMRLEDVCLGFGCVDLKKYRTFPPLLTYARSCGVVAPRVLERLNKRRNAVEHEFDIPKIEDVENFVDIVELFLAATDRWEFRMPSTIDYYGTTPASVDGHVLREISFDWSAGKVNLAFKLPKARPISPAERVTLSSPSEEFFQCVRFVLANDG